MSYVSKQFLPMDNSTTNFRLWGSALSAALASMGWTQSSDTGQVNWTTVTAPAAGTFVYEIWKPGDGGTVFYLQLRYSTSSNSGGRITAQLGTSTNGSGTLTGFTTNVMEPSNSNGQGGGATLTYECNFSGDINRLGIMMFRTWVQGTNNPGSPWLITCERTHNTDGSDNNTGVTLVVGNNGGGSNVSQQTIVFGVGAAPAPSTRNYVTLSNFNNGSGAYNNNIPVSPLFPVYGLYDSPMTGIAAAHTQDVADGCEFTTTLYGSTRTYMAIGNINPNRPDGNTILCMRYD